MNKKHVEFMKWLHKEAIKDFEIYLKKSLKVLKALQGERTIKISYKKDGPLF